MPNNFSDEYGSKGILENNQYWNKVEPGHRFLVPTDWTIFIEFKAITNPPYFYVNLKTWVTDIIRDDIHLSDAWQPTEVFDHYEEIWQAK